MKKLLPILLLFASVNLSAQTYVPFDFENSNWCYGRQWHVGIPPTYQQIDYRLEASHDTLYRGHQYKAIYRKQASVDNQGYVIYSSTGSLHALVREENKKIYAKYYNSFYIEEPIDSEVVIYDFNIQVGDSFGLQDVAPNCCTNGYYLVAKKIDSTQTNLGYRKCIKLLPTYQTATVMYINGVAPNDTIVWIEGIGSNKGIFYDIDAEIMGSGFCSIYFNCFNYNNQYIYGTGNCFQFTTDIKENSNTNNITIYPNPTSNVINLQLPQNISIGNIQLYNALGSIVASYPIKEQIDVSNLRNGIYYLQLISKDQLYFQKVIIER
jgi:hypothetical protein